MILDGSNGVTFNDASLQGAAASPFGLKNRIINGDMRIDQRNAGASVTVNSASNFFSCDRFACSGTSSAGVYTIQQVSDAPTGFTNSLKITTTTASASIGSSADYLVGQKIEGFNFADMQWGTANAQTVTLSFRVKSSLTGTFSGVLANDAWNRSYVFSYVINAANTWETKTITIAGDTTGTWVGATNGTGLRIFFSMGSGSSYVTTANTWTSGTYETISGATNVISTLSATWQITGVQLEVGSTATPFERRQYGQELVSCQRYYSKSYDVNVAPGSNNSNGLVVVGGSSNTGNNQQVDIRFKVSMRTSPTVTGYYSTGTINTWDYGRNGAAGNTTPTFDLIGENGCRVYASVGAAWVVSNLGGHYTASAEL
jgi:hypothetical protein